MSDHGGRQTGLKDKHIVVLTASDHIRDVNQAYKLGANSFMVKPSEFQNFVELGKSLHNYRLRQSKAPEISRDSEARHAHDWQPPHQT